MPTISARRAARGAAALLLLGAGSAAWAGPTIEIDPRYESFESRVACEKALQRRHGAALARLAALSSSERGGNRVDGLRRDGDDQLTYFELLDLTGETADALMPGSQREDFTCRGNRLEHRISLDAPKS